MKRKPEAVRTDPNPGYAVIVGGPHPYVADFISLIGPGSAKALEQAEALCTQPYHKARPAVVITRSDYRRLLRAAKGRKRCN